MPDMPDVSDIPHVAEALSIREAAVLTGRSEAAIYHLIATGQLPGRRRCVAWQSTPETSRPGARQALVAVVAAAAGAGVAEEPEHAATAKSRGETPLHERAPKPSRVAVALAPATLRLAG